MDCMQIDVLIDIFSFGLVEWGGTGLLGVGWIIWGPQVGLTRNPYSRYRARNLHRGKCNIYVFICVNQLSAMSII